MQFAIGVKIDECQQCGRTCLLKTYSHPLSFMEGKFQEDDTVEMCAGCFRNFLWQVEEYRQELEYASGH